MTRARAGLGRWGWILAAVLTVVVVAGGVTATVLLVRRSDSPSVSGPDVVGVDPQYLLAPIKSIQPTVGWTLRLQDVIPGATGGLAYFGPVTANRAYYTADDAHQKLGAKPGALVSTRTWVFGVDLATGKLALAPVELPGAAKCLVNGPTMILCIDDVTEGREKQVWVIDSTSGAIIHSGPTNLSPYNTKHGPYVQQYGAYALVTVDKPEFGETGWYGVGSRAELTWHVPSVGNPIYGGDVFSPDWPTPTMVATDRSVDVDGKTQTEYIVFSLVDGTVFHDDAYPAASLPWITADGWVAKVLEDNVAAIAFYDSTGKRVKLVQQEGKNRLSLFSPSHYGLPIILDETPSGEETWNVYDTRGQKLVALHGVRGYAKASEATEGRIVGTRVFFRAEEPDSGDDPVWTQADLKTGKPGASCDKVDLGVPGYLASDGKVVISRPLITVGSAAGEDRVNAVDTSNCTVLWSIPIPPDSGRIYRRGNTIIRNTDNQLEEIVVS
ncbi:hypothetical protein [Mycobacteroides abscessus]|uniref:hypothetical protein n=1 Tax=Mycobacteroides abscessus TaxID=36809 RepID=UPI00092AA945|nr:hypothetical protein [Mycobacteroides abscessus]MDO3103899.1 hypothetical protein [Mycobacteroides abscessus subsp. abscessus]MDO3338743.1 hypothetical protein [Mycobacteroides abscessus subsp. abscessus]QOF27065.1 hypothetical protein E3G43_000593 [Mycobacteroides abscessus]RIR45272.1 hypothetical protein D2E36_02490 [Mycobacteroides abscessus]RIT59588.1 hypothetical protein D2E95_10505 [Mycobacteroides abscessus]